MTKDDLYKMYSTAEPEFISNYHGNTGWTLDQCVDDAWNTIKDLELYMYDWGYFSVYRSPISSMLVGFFIYPSYRTQEYKDKFFNEVCSKMPETFYSIIRTTYFRGVKFYSKYGEVCMKNDDYTTFVFKKRN